MNKVILIALTLFAFTACNVFNSDDDDNGDNGDQTEETTDVAISDVSAPDFVIAGTSAEIRVTIEDLADYITTDSITVTLANETVDFVIATRVISTAELTDTTNVHFDWDTDGATIGEHTIVASHDYEDDDNENNSRSTTISVNEQMASDIAVTDISAPQSATTGEDAEIEVTLQNAGEEGISEDITLTLFNETDGSSINEQTIEGLEVGEEITLTFTWNTADSSPGEYTITASHDFEDDNDTNNSQTTTITVNEPLESDVAVTAINADDNIAIGAETQVEATIQNTGEEDVTEEFTVILSDDTDGTTIGTQTIDGLNIGEETTLSFDWNTTDFSAGEHTLTVTHDFDDGDLTNNSQSISVTLTDEEATDIAVSAINAPESVSLGEDATIEVTVQNTGGTNITGDVDITLHNETEGADLETQTISSLNSGDETTLTFTWSTAGTTSGNYTLVATLNFEDDDESNNSQSTTIMVEETETSDISITVINYPEFVTRGDAAEIEVELENVGNIDVNQAISVLLTHHEIEEAEPQTLQTGLAAGSTATVTLLWDTEGQTTGEPPHPIVLQHDYDDGLYSNNADTVYIRVDMPE